MTLHVQKYSKKLFFFFLHHCIYDITGTYKLLMNDDRCVYGSAGFTWSVFQADLRKFNADLKRETKEIKNLKKIQLRNPSDRQSIVSSSCTSSWGLCTSCTTCLSSLDCPRFFLQLKTNQSNWSIWKKLPADQSRIYPVPKELKEPGWMWNTLGLFKWAWSDSAEVNHKTKYINNSIFFFSTTYQAAGIKMVRWLEDSDKHKYLLVQFATKQPTFPWLHALSLRFVQQTIAWRVSSGLRSPYCLVDLQAEVSAQKASNNAQHSVRQLEEAITDFQRQKLEDIQVSLVKWILLMILYLWLLWSEITGPIALIHSFHLNNNTANGGAVVSIVTSQQEVCNFKVVGRPEPYDCWERLLQENGWMDG